MSAVQLDAVTELFNQVSDIESKLKQLRELRELNENQLVDITIAACLANCRVVEALKKEVKWKVESLKVN